MFVLTKPNHTLNDMVLAT